jgi:transposase-like protein
MIIFGYVASIVKSKECLVFRHNYPAINLLLILAGFATMIEICQVKYLNNIIEQDHRFIKKITKPMMGFKAFHSAQATIVLVN